MFYCSLTCLLDYLCFYMRTKNNHIFRHKHGRRRKQLLNGLKEKRKYYNMKEGDLVLEMATDMSKDRLDNEYTCYNSGVCQPLCVFKVYGEVSSVKNTTINIWLNNGVY